MDQTSQERIRLSAQSPSKNHWRATASRNRLLQITVLLAALAPLPVFGAAASIPVSPRPSVNAEQSLLAAANRERAARGIPQLRFDPVLAEAARFHAMQMAAHANISHQFSGEPDLSARGANAGAHFSLISENVAEAPNVSMFHDMWMHSKGHRENLLDPRVNVVGVAIVVRNGQYYAVEDFASTVESLSFNRQEEAVNELLARTGLAVGPTGRTSTLAQARMACSMDSGFPGRQKPWFIMRYSADRLDRLPSQLESRIRSGKYHQAVVGACQDSGSGSFTAYSIAVLLYP
jgi:uncharacterized protein YkwD